MTNNTIAVIAGRKIIAASAILLLFAAVFFLCGAHAEEMNNDEYLGFLKIGYCRSNLITESERIEQEKKVVEKLLTEDDLKNYIIAKQKQENGGKCPACNKRYWLRVCKRRAPDDPPVQPAPPQLGTATTAVATESGSDNTEPATVISGPVSSAINMSLIIGLCTAAGVALSVVSVFVLGVVITVTYLKTRKRNFFSIYDKAMNDKFKTMINTEPLLNGDIDESDAGSDVEEEDIEEGAVDGHIPRTHDDEEEEDDNDDGLVREQQPEHLQDDENTYADNAITTYDDQEWEEDEYAEDGEQQEERLLLQEETVTQGDKDTLASAFAANDEAQSSVPYTLHDDDGFEDDIYED